MSEKFRQRNAEIDRIAKDEGITRQEARDLYDHHLPPPDDDRVYVVSLPEHTMSESDRKSEAAGDDVAPYLFGPFTAAEAVAEVDDFNRVARSESSTVRAEVWPVRGRAALRAWPGV